MNSPTGRRSGPFPALALPVVTLGTLALAVACAPAAGPASAPAPEPAATAEAPPAPATAPRVTVVPSDLASPPSPDPRTGLAGGLLDAEEAIWNMRMLSTTPPPPDFIGVTNSDLAFTGPYAIQGNYNGFIVWDLSDPQAPQLVVDYLCPASQSDVSVYGDLLFVSGEGLGGRLDCGVEGVPEAVSEDRLRGIRIFDISDIRNPVYVHNVQTCRGSHTHTVLKHPGDRDNVYIYVSGSAPVRPYEELPGCIAAPPFEDPESALFRIEVIQVPLADPTQAAIVSSPRIFDDLVAAPIHGLAPADRERLERAQEEGIIAVEAAGDVFELPPEAAAQWLAAAVAERGGTGAPTAADSAAVREQLQVMITEIFTGGVEAPDGTRLGPTQCHDITVYPEMGLAGGACEGYGLLLDIRDPVNPRRMDAVADSNFAYWHSATFNNDATTVLFTDEWGGGGGAKCRASDPVEWGANAIYSIENGRMVFQSYYKLPAPQSDVENCVAHNGSLIPVPGRDIKVQAWYQGGISIFDFTDPANPFEIAFHDRGPVNEERMESAGPWSVYWYNGLIVSSEIARGLDVFELVPSVHLTANEIEAANTVHMEEFNPQGQPLKVWPPSFARARALVDQLERSGGLSSKRIREVRGELDRAESETGATRHGTLESLAGALGSEAAASADHRRIGLLVEALEALLGN